MTPGLGWYHFLLLLTSLFFLQGHVTRHLILGGITLERERHRTGMTLGPHSQKVT
jgi:hypothetical protein